MLAVYKRKRIITAIVVALLLVPVMVFAVSDSVSAVTYVIPDGYTTIVDPNLYDCVVAKFKREFSSESIPDTGLTDEQLGRMPSLSCSGYDKADSEKITDTTGVEKMTSLTSLSLNYHNIVSIDLSNNTALTSLSLLDNRLSLIDLSNNTALTYLSLYSNKLTSIDLSHNTALTNLTLGKNQLTSIDLSHNTALTSFFIRENQLTSIDLSNNSALTSISLGANRFSSIDVSNNTALTYLAIDDNQLTSIDVSNNTALTTLYLFYNLLSSIDVSNNTALTSLSIEGNRITSVDLSKNTNLRNFESDNILVYTGVTPTKDGDNYNYDLSALRYMTDYRTIDNTDDYAYDVDDALLTVSDPMGAGRFAQVIVSKEGYLHRYFRLRLANVLYFDLDGGTGSFETMVCSPEFDSGKCTIVLSTDKPMRTGYDFLGWAGTADATSAVYQPGEEIEIGKSKIVYAVWTQPSDNDEKEEEIPVPDSGATNDSDGIKIDDTKTDDTKVPNTGGSMINNENAWQVMISILPAVAVLLYAINIIRSRRKMQIKFD